MFRKRHTHDRARRAASGLSYANVTATLALFVALGGTAAAVGLERDSVGSLQIQKDAVRSSEIRDDTIRLGDVSDGARDALRGNLRVAEDDFAPVPECSNTDLTACPNLMTIRLPAAKSWLVEANFSIVGFFSTNNRCGLVRSDTETIHAIGEIGTSVNFGSEQIALAGVVGAVESGGPRIVALRCSELAEDDLTVRAAKITALEVGTVTGP